MAHGIRTLGQILAENSVAKRKGDKIPHVIPTLEEADKMPLNRAEARNVIRHFPRDMRKQVFGRSRIKRVHI